MKVKELIAELQKLPQEMSVNVFDYRKNLFRGGGDSCSDGIEAVTGACIVPDDETVKLMSQDGEEITQWVAIEYANDDYTDDSKFSDVVTEQFEKEAVLNDFVSELSAHYGAAISQKAEYVLKKYLGLAGRIED